MSNTPGFPPYTKLTQDIPLGFPPYTVPVVDKDGFMTQSWVMWFQQMYSRIGGTTPINSTIPTRLLANSYVKTHAQAFQAPLVPYYTSPSGSSTIMDSVSVKNVSPFSVTLDIWVVPVGEQPTDSNKALDAFAFPGNSTTPIPGLSTIQVGSNGYIIASASVGGVLLLSLNGRQIS